MPANTIFLFVILAIFIGVIVLGLAGIAILAWQQDYLDTAIQLAWAWLNQEVLHLGLLPAEFVTATSKQRFRTGCPARSPGSSSRN